MLLRFSSISTAGAYCIYEDPLDMLQHLDEVGVRELACA
jgi:hypothetical protein